MLEKLQNGPKLISYKFLRSKMAKKGKKINLLETANFLKFRIFCFFRLKSFQTLINWGLFLVFVLCISTFGILQKIICKVKI